MNYEAKAYAVKWESDIRNNSASGGLFPAIAKYILEERNGYVCGCVLEDLIPKHIVSNKWNDIERMQDSKYVQSSIGTCFSEISDLLKNGETVLFTGTSCQVKGLLEFLEIKKIESAGLLTMDFFCHGVPSPLIWKEFLSYYELKKNREVVGYRFRPKKYGWRRNNHLNSLFYKCGNSIKEDNWSYLGAHIWDSLFFGNMCLRPSCYECHFATHLKPADITMGDFWGIEDCLPVFDDGKGCSLAIIHTLKAQQILDDINYIDKEKVEVGDAIKKQINSKGPCKRPETRDSFWKCYHEYGFSNLIKSYCFYNPKRRSRAFLNRILFQFGLRNKA